MRWILKTLVLATMGMGLSFGLSACDDGGESELNAKAVCERITDSGLGLMERCEFPGANFAERDEMIDECMKGADPDARVPSSFMSKCQKDVKAISCEEFFSDGFEGIKSCQELAEQLAPED